MIDDKLLHAYRTAKYIVEYNNQALRLRVGQEAEFIEPLLAQHQVNSAFFITPENPFSCALTQQENTLRHTRVKFCRTGKKQDYSTVPDS